MIHIKYGLDKSDKHGIGLFAGEDIKMGVVVYTSSPLLDVNITQEEFNTLSENEKNEIMYWGFFDDLSKKWHVDFDVSKFVNHSDNATLTQDSTKHDAYLVTTRDILKGEELTQNYLEFDTKKDLAKRGILTVGSA